jgi:hypothetical protein
MLGICKNVCNKIIFPPFIHSSQHLITHNPNQNVRNLCRM